MQTITDNKKKIMLIVWKWADLIHINEKIWKEKDFKPYFADVNKGHDKFFKEYKVEPSILCHDASVVAVTIYNSGNLTRQLLHALIESYAKPENELVVLLHRSDFYKEEDVDALLDRFEYISNCFLFADGRDYIYYDTQKSGLLDHVGNFFVGFEANSTEKVETIKDGEVQQPYFDRVWEYYQSEFETKVFQLKEELFTQWFPFLLPSYPEEISCIDLLNAIREADDRVLFFRLKSFTDQYAVIKNLDKEKHFDRFNELETEKKKIESFEKESGESFIFDDCIKNINHHKNNERDFVANSYKEVCDSLNKILFDNTQKSISKTEIRNLAHQFNYLVKVIPGELD